MDGKRFEELASRWVAEHALPPEEERALAEALVAQPGLQGELLDDARIDGALAALGRESRDAEAFARQFEKRVAAEQDARQFVSQVEARLRGPRPVSRGRRWPLVTLGLAAAAGLALAVGLRSSDTVDPRPEPSARMEEREQPVPVAPGSGPSEAAEGSRAMPRLASALGHVFLVVGGRTASVPVGATIASGRGILTIGSQSRAELVFPDGTRVEVGGDTTVPQVAGVAADGGKSVFLARGWMRATVPPRTGVSFVVTTPHAEATALGTRFIVEVGDAGTRVDVTEGSVRLARHTEGSKADVRAGHYGLAQEGQDVVVLAKPRGSVLYVVGSVVPSPADALVADRLRSMGFDVVVQGAGRPREADLQRAALVVLSSTLTSDDVDIHYGHLPVPILTWEAWLYDDLGMTRTASEGGEADSTRFGPHYAEVIIKHRGHPLAAGLDGAVPVSRARLRMTYGKPSPTADWIATLPGDPTRAVIFAYEKGALLATMVPAPARRVGFFLWDDTAPRMNEAGWKLFEAAVLWCADGS